MDALIEILDVRGRAFSFPWDNTTKTGVDLLAYGRIGDLPFIAGGRFNETSGWSGVWNWTCGQTLGGPMRRKLIAAIKQSALTSAALATPAPETSDGWSFTVDFHLAHGEKHVIPYSDTAAREAIKARGATFFKAPSEPFWIALV